MVVGMGKRLSEAERRRWDSMELHRRRGNTYVRLLNPGTAVRYRVYEGMPSKAMVFRKRVTSYASISGHVVAGTCFWTSDRDPFGRRWKSAEDALRGVLAELG